MHYGKPLSGKYMRGVDRYSWSPQSFCKKFHQTKLATQHISFVIITLGPHGSTSLRESRTATIPLPRWSLVNPASSSLGLCSFGRSRCKWWPCPSQGSFCTLRCQFILSLPFNSTPPHGGAAAIFSFLKSSSTDGFMSGAPWNFKCLKCLLFPVCFRKIVLAATISESSKQCSVRITLPLSFVLDIRRWWWLHLTSRRTEVVSVASCKILYPVLCLGIRSRCSTIKFACKYIIIKTALNRDLESLTFKEVRRRTRLYMALLFIQALKSGVTHRDRKVWLSRCIWFPSYWRAPFWHFKILKLS